jgi:3-isopropylmalate dehydrogenase
VRVLKWVAAERKLDLQLDPFDFGAERFLKTGVSLPEGQIEIFRKDYNAILFGAVGDPRVKDLKYAREILLAMRFELDLYVNFRPCRLLLDSLSPLKGKGKRELDMVIFRENTEGMYHSIGGFMRKGTPDEISVAEEVNTRRGVERIIRAAFAWATKNGKHHVAMADKSNALPAHDLWLRTFREVAQEYPNIEAKHYFIDAITMQMVLRPETLQVIVTNNLFGDILTDLGAALTGGLGVAASANLNPGHTSLFEPVHGTAPDIAGKGVANPMGAILSSALMLSELGFSREATLLERAVQATLEAGHTTRDLGGSMSTVQVADQVLRAAESLLRAES